MAAKNKRWTEEAINNATKDVLEGNLSVRCVAIQYDIPLSTLHDCISGKVSGTGSGPPHYLDEEEEREQVESLLGCAEVGYTKTVKEVRVMVSKIVAKSNIKILEALHLLVMAGGKSSRKDIKSFLYVPVKSCPKEEQ